MKNKGEKKGRGRYSGEDVFKRKNEYKTYELNVVKKDTGKITMKSEGHRRVTVRLSPSIISYLDTHYHDGDKVVANVAYDKNRTKHIVLTNLDDYESI